MTKYIIIIFITLTIQNTAFSKVSEEENTFLNKVFQDNIPKKQRFILIGENKNKIKEIMGEKYKKRLFSFWQKDKDKVWILNSIGKYKPITAGFVTSNCKIKSSHVIVYREQHGYEIKYPSFLLQFTEGELNSNMKLDFNVDNISGATLSVNSMKRMAQAALLLDKLSNENTCT